MPLDLPQRPPRLSERPPECDRTAEPEKETRRILGIKFEGSKEEFVSVYWAMAICFASILFLVGLVIYFTKDGDYFFLQMMGWMIGIYLVFKMLTSGAKNIITGIGRAWRR